MIKVVDAQFEDCPGIAKVQVDRWKTAYKDILPKETLDELSIKKKSQFWKKAFKQDKKTHLLIVAKLDSGEIIGFIAAGPPRDKDKKHKAEIYSLYVEEKFCGKGVGTYLFGQAKKKLAELKMTSLVTWVLADNPYKRFYPKQGGKEMAPRKIVLDGRHYEETGFEWPWIG